MGGIYINGFRVSSFPQFVL